MFINVYKHINVYVCPTEDKPNNSLKDKPNNSLKFH